MSNWISVKDRLPEEGDEVLAADNYGDIEMCMMVRTRDGHLRFSSNEREYSDLCDVTHWQKLPAPPAERE